MKVWRECEPVQEFALSVVNIPVVENVLVAGAEESVVTVVVVAVSVSNRNEILLSSGSETLGISRAGGRSLGAVTLAVSC